MSFPKHAWHIYTPGTPYSTASLTILWHVTIHAGRVTFRYRDRSDENKEKEVTVKAGEFIRRFLLHILPHGFMKIRYYGFLAHTNKKTTIPLLRKLIDPHAKIAEKTSETIQEIMLRLTGVDITLCPECGLGEMISIESLPIPGLDTS